MATTARVEIAWQNDATQVKFQAPPAQTIPIVPPAKKPTIAKGDGNQHAPPGKKPR